MTSTPFHAAILKLLHGAVMVTDLSGVVQGCNAPAERLLGLVPGQALGQMVWEVCPVEIRPELHECFVGKPRPLERGGSALCLLADTRFLKLKWSVRMVEAAPGGMLVQFDELEPATDEATLAQDRGEQLAGIVNSLNDAIISVDEDFRIVFLNDCAQEIFGCPRASAIGQHIDLFPCLSSALKHLDLGMFKTDGGEAKSAQQFQGRRADGEMFPMEATLASVSLHGRRYFTACIRDISEQVQVEQALYQAQKTQAIGALASGVAHDFNNILTAILSHLDLVTMEEQLLPHLRESIVHAQTSARRGAELVSKLLAFSRSSEVKPVTVNPASLVEEVLIMLRRSINPSIRVNHLVDSPDLWAVRADTSQIMQVLMNLCLNARDAMPAGGELTLQLENVHFAPVDGVAPRRAGDFVRLSVRDTGEGMRPEVLNRLGEPYFTTKQFGKGTGLGLSIAYSVVAEHHGWVEVQSAPGEGTCFHVYIPRAKEEPAFASASRPTVTEAADGSLEGSETILIIDDDELVRWIVRAVLAYRGYRVVEAVNGEDGIEKYRQGDPRIDLVLLDLYMPRVNGWETLGAIRAQDPDARVILLSGGGMEGDKEKAAQMGATDFFAKPFENQALLRLVRATLDQAKATA